MKDINVISSGAYVVYYGNFYKFLGVEGAIATLRNGSLKYSNPKIFNDPFDCDEKLIFLENPINIAFDLDGVGEELEKFDLTGAKKKQVLNIIRTIVGLYDSFNPEYKEKVDILLNRFILHPEIRKDLERLKICCFSRQYKTKKSALMWSHYSQNHYGICLEFNIKEIANDDDVAKNMFIPFVVEYPSKLGVKSIDVGKRYHNDWLFRKSNIWEYEKEVRMVQKTTDPKDIEYYQFPKRALKKIIFGYHTTQETIEEIKGIIVSKYDVSKIKFEKMGMDPKILVLKAFEYDIDLLRLRILNRNSEILDSAISKFDKIPIK